jgi:hypothetical protein
MALLKYTGNIDLSRNGILDILKIQGPDSYEGLSNSLEITTKDETGKGSGSLVLRSGSGNTTGSVYLFAGSYTDLDKIKGITLTTNKISINHTEVEVLAGSLTRTVADAEFIESIGDTGYSATAATAYNITSNTSTTLKNKALTIIAGKDGATVGGVSSVNEASGYYTLCVPATDAGLSEEYVDKVNVRNLFSQTGGDFKLGDSSNNTVSRIGSIILNSSTLSSNINASVSLTSPEIVIGAQDSSDSSKSSERGRLLVTSPNGDFRLEIDNKTEDKDVSKLTIRDIESKNSTITNNITLSSNTEAATIKVPKSLTVNAVEFTLNQVNNSDSVVDNSKASEGNAVLTSKISDKKDTLGKRIATLNVENATINTSLTSSVLTTLNGDVKVNEDKNDGAFGVGGASSSIQSSTINLGTSKESRSTLNTYIGTQTSDIAKLVESIGTSLTRTLGDEKVVEEFNGEGYSVTTDTSFTFTGKSTNIINVGSGSLTVTGPSSYSLTLDSSTAKEVLKDLELSQSYNQAAGKFTIANNNSKATSVKVYSTDTGLNSTKLTVSAGSGDYAYLLTVDEDNSKSSLSVRDATFNNDVSIANTLTLENDNFNIKAEGDTTLTAKKDFKIVGDEQSDTILSSTLNDSTRTTSLTVENGTFKMSLASNTGSILNGTTKITGTTLTIDASTAELLSPEFKIGESSKEITSLNAYIIGTNLTGATLSETLNTSITRSVANKTFEETIDSTGIELNSTKSYSLNAYADFNIRAGGDSTSYPLSISAGTTSSKIKATYLEATDYATVKNHVDLGDIRIKYDSSSQSLIFGAV